MQSNPRSLDEVLNRLKNFNSANETPTEASPPTPKPPKQSEIAKLKEAYDKFHAPISVKPGDIVRGKKGLAENFNDWDKPHVILEQFETPRLPAMSAREASMNCAAYIYHGVMGKLHDDGQLHTYLCDFRLWEVIPESELKGR